MNEQNNGRPRRPNPGKSAQQPRPSGNKNAQAKPVRDARVPEEFRREQTAVFDKVERGQQRRADDGLYNYTGRDIKSSRQKFAEPDEDISVRKNKRGKPKRDDVDLVETRGGAVPGIVKAILYLVGVVGVSLIISYNLIMIVNDVFAFVKDESVVEVTLPYDANIDSISRVLGEHNLIRYPWVFRIYAGLRGRNRDWEFRGGETFVLSSDMPYDEFILQLRVRPAARQEIRLTFPEGWTIDDMIDRLVENGVGSRSRFEYVINNHRWDDEYDFLRPLYAAGASPYRRFMLEGFMFPDTYDFFTDESEFDVIRKFLNNFRARFDVRSFERLNILNMTLDELVNLASIIQREVRHPEDFAKVSAVFHNRLLNPAFPMLESDATILYDRDLVHLHGDLTPAEIAVLLHEAPGRYSPFNTYHRPGLPPSPIANPGMDAIHAALEPHEDYVGYYFFIAQPDGRNLYARTYAEHLVNIVTVNAMWEDLRAE